MPTKIYETERGRAKRRRKYRRVIPSPGNKANGASYKMRGFNRPQEAERGRFVISKQRRVFLWRLKEFLRWQRRLLGEKPRGTGV